MNRCPQASDRTCAASFAKAGFWKNPPWRVLPLVLLILGPAFSQAQSYSIDTIAHEVSVFNFGQPSTTSEAISREVSVFNSGQPSYGTEAISREVSVYNEGAYGVDAISREVSVYNLGYNQLSFTVGSTVLLAGTTGQVPVSFWTIVPVTSIQLTVEVPQDLLTNWSVQPLTPLQGSVVATNNNLVYVNFSVPPGGLKLNTTQVLDQITFFAVSNQPTAYLKVQAADVTVARADGIMDTPISSLQDGYVVVLNKRSLLHLSGQTNGLQYVTLYGFSGTNYTIESTTNLSPPVVWSPDFDLTPSNFIGLLPGLVTTNAAMFYRAVQ